MFEKEVADARVPLSPPTAEIRGGRECLVETAAEVGLRLVSLDEDTAHPKTNKGGFVSREKLGGRNKVKNGNHRVDVPHMLGVSTEQNVSILKRTT